MHRDKDRRHTEAWKPRKPFICQLPALAQNELGIASSFVSFFSRGRGHARQARFGGENRIVN